MASLWIFVFSVNQRYPPRQTTRNTRGNFIPHTKKKKSVETPWRILSLFTTRFRLRMNSLYQRLWWHRHVVFLWSRSFFLRCITADPSPWRNFTPPTKHECGETLGDLEPVYDPFPIMSEHNVWTSFVEQVVFLTVNHRGPLPLKELHSTDETWMWRDPGGSWACLRPVSIKSELAVQRLWHRHVCGSFVKQVVFLTMNHRGPLPFRKLHSTEETWVWRDPEGPVYDLFPIKRELALPEAVTQTCMRRLGGTGPVEKVVVFTVDHRGTLTSRELNQ